MKTIAYITALLLLVLLTGPGVPARAQAVHTVVADTADVKVYFRQGHSELDMQFRGNGARLDSFAASLREPGAQRRVKAVHVIGTASPEGSTTRNRELSEQRAGSIVVWLKSRLTLPDSLYVTYAMSEDWDGLAALVEACDAPWRDEALDIIRNTPVWVVRGGKVVDGRKRRLSRLRGGEPWRYMLRNFFPELRSSAGGVLCEIIREPEAADTAVISDTVVCIAADSLPPVDTPYVADTPPAETRPFYMSVWTNMLYDALLVPNIGVEFYLGRGWSIGAGWMYAWWKKESKPLFWRVYGGDLTVRKYLGRKAAEKPLTGHHLGLYGQMLTYDFELGGKGYLGDRWSWGVGVEYGYSMPVARRLNIDFSIGVGYLGGKYKVYEPMDGHYVWQRTHQRHWFGPTRAAVSLVWLLGHGNYNSKKGETR